MAQYRRDRAFGVSSDRNEYRNNRRGGRSTRSGFRNDRHSVNRRETGGLIASDKVEGTPVYDPDGERLGTIENFMVGKRSGRVEYAVLSFGGFLGIGERHFPIPWDELDYDEDENGYIVNITERDLEEAPSHRAGEQIDYGRGYGSDVRHYYGRH